ncbi:hypothetical protein F6X53_26940 [Methylobacterium soli]|uniref:Uncharacterized protein n=1 Tax=Methylobacterium soli TaxID=553447 RepID=A0A6L3STG1_9HYPH|nr:hypothetical protein F6X53_26940 [Methylobacterium soli]GJE44083.1 hypothetical protein AEGHOMDF_3269 [Methylobacterium soli]
MYAEGGWEPPQKPPRPPRRERQLSERQKLVLVWLIAVNALLLLIAPIGGASVIHALVAVLRHG